jgi:hypothetical protein
MKAAQDDVLSLLKKYEEERTSVLAVFGTPSQSVARVTGRFVFIPDHLSRKK